MPTTLPNLGLIGRWADGEDGWGDEINDAIDILSIFVQCRVLSRVGALPGSPTDGDLHIFTGAGPEANQLVARINGAWEYFTPQEGYRVYDLNTEEYLSFIGSAWVADPTTLVSSFLDLSDITGDYTGRAGFSVVVNSTEDGLEFLNLGSGADDFLDLTDTPSSYSGRAGYAVVVNGDEDGLEFSPINVDVEAFTDLGDVPSDYSGQANKLVAVNGTEDGLEFVDAPNGLPTIAPGDAGKVLTVNGTEDGVEWATPTGGGGGGPLDQVSVGSSRDMLDTDFEGNKLLVCNSGSAITLTIESGLVETAPCLIYRAGAESVAVAAGSGVTIRSPGGALSLRLQRSMATLIPLGSDEYVLAGDIW